MAKDGTLANLYVQMREQKAVDTLLEKVQVEEVELQANPAEEKPAEEKKDWPQKEVTNGQTRMTNQ